MVFDRDGNLYLATGDNTNPFDSDGYAPIDERAGRSAWDAQRTSANTNDLRGKVLRIKPAGRRRLHDPGRQPVRRGGRRRHKTRPEIYAMGFRNPFRIGIDEQTNKLLVADYGPDAERHSADPRPQRPGRVEHPRPAGQLRLALLRRRQHAYNDYDFATAPPARRSTVRRRSTTRPTTPA